MKRSSYDGKRAGEAPESSYGKILVAQTSFLGDVILTTPLVAEIRRRFPKWEVAVLCTAQARPLWANNPDIDRIIIDDKRGTDRGWRGLLRKAREVRGYDFRIAVSPHKSLRTALLLALATIPCRIGFRQSAGWFLYHRRVRRDAALHEVDRNLSLLRALGLDPEESGRTIRLEVSPGAEREGETLLSSLGIQKDETVFGIHPGSVWPTKRWSLEGYAELMARLKQKYSCRILLFGGPEDQEFTDRLQRLSGNLGVCLAGKIGLAELPWAIGRCRVFITNDSGPMHMAVARGVPVVAIFCATTVSLGFYPYAAGAVVVEKNLACRPCGTHGGRRCPLGTEDCIRLIGPDDVLRGVEMVLEGAATAEPPPGFAPRPHRIRV